MTGQSKHLANGYLNGFKISILDIQILPGKININGAQLLCSRCGKPIEVGPGGCDCTYSEDVVRLFIITCNQPGCDITPSYASHGIPLFACSCCDESRSYLYIILMNRTDFSQSYGLTFSVSDLNVSKGSTVFNNVISLKHVCQFRNSDMLSERGISFPSHEHGMHGGGDEFLHYQLRISQEQTKFSLSSMLSHTKLSTGKRVTAFQKAFYLTKNTLDQLGNILTVLYFSVKKSTERTEEHLDDIPIDHLEATVDRKKLKVVSEKDFLENILNRMVRCGMEGNQKQGEVMKILGHSLAENTKSAVKGVKLYIKKRTSKRVSKKYIKLVKALSKPQSFTLPDQNVSFLIDKRSLRQTCSAAEKAYHKLLQSFADAYDSLKFSDIYEKDIRFKVKNDKRTENGLSENLEGKETSEKAVKETQDGEKRDPGGSNEDMRLIGKIPGAVYEGPITICLRQNEKVSTTGLVEKSKTPVIFVSNEEKLRQLFEDFLESETLKKDDGFKMHFLTHGHGRFQRGRLVSPRPLTFTEMRQLDMSNYYNRLATYADWPNNSFSSLILAKAGFIYQGGGQEVECFSCGFTLRSFPEDPSSFDVRRQHRDNCNFLQSLGLQNTTETDVRVTNSNSRECGEISKIQMPADHSSNTLNHSVSDMSSKNLNVADNLHTDNTSNHSDESGASTGRQVTANNITTDNGSTSSNESVVDSSRRNNVLGTDIKGLSFENIIVSNPLNWSVDNTSNLSDNILGAAKHPQFIFIHNRLASFRGWSFRHIKEPRDLVEAGFYNTGKEDIVRCFYCDIGLADWDPEDDPWVEHARHSPHCAFVKEKRGDEFIENIQATWRRIYCPKHQKYEDYDARLRSFVKWPSDVSQRPKQLAAAGFYYTGEEDVVRCHYCDGGLQHWEEGDMPWTEHARWFPFCKFVVKMKGLAFIEEIARYYNNLAANIEIPNGTSSRHTENQNTESNKRHAYDRDTNSPLSVTNRPRMSDAWSQTEDIEGDKEKFQIRKFKQIKQSRSMSKIPTKCNRCGTYAMPVTQSAADPKNNEVFQSSWLPEADIDTEQPLDFQNLQHSFPSLYSDQSKQSDTLSSFGSNLSHRQTTCSAKHSFPTSYMNKPLVEHPKKGKVDQSNWLQKGENIINQRSGNIQRSPSFLSDQIKKPCNLSSFGVTVSVSDCSSNDHSDNDYDQQTIPKEIY